MKIDFISPIWPNTWFSCGWNLKSRFSNNWNSVTRMSPKTAILKVFLTFSGENYYVVKMSPRGLIAVIDEQKLIGNLKGMGELNLIFSIAIVIKDKPRCFARLSKIKVTRFSMLSNKDEMRCFKMRPRISISCCVCPSVRPSLRPSVPPWHFAKTTIEGKRSWKTSYLYRHSR